MDKHAVIKNGIVENVIVWDGVEKHDLPTGTEVQKSNEAAIGWVCKDGKLEDPTAIEPTSQPTTIFSQPTMITPL
jgi:hypothetical protein